MQYRNKVVHYCSVLDPVKKVIKIFFAKHPGLIVTHHPKRAVGDSTNLWQEILKEPDDHRPVPN